MENNEKEYVVYGSVKKFKQSSYDENDPLAKAEGVILLKQYGWEVIKGKELFKLGDLYFSKTINNKIETKLIEFERRGDCKLDWTKDCFKWPTLHIPQRKAGKTSIYDYYIAFNFNLNRAALIKREDIISSKIIYIDTINHKTKEITKNEPFHDVDCSKICFLKKINSKWIKSNKCGRIWVNR